MAAGYELNTSLTDDETAQFTMFWDQADGSPFPWADWTIEYTVRQDCGSAYDDDYGHGRSYGQQAVVQTLSTLTGGVTIDTTANTVTFTLTRLLRPGRYRHGCRLISKVGATSVQVFDGGLTISEGNL